MSYYFISFDQSIVDQFLKSFSSLGNIKWVKDKQQLQDLLSKSSSDDFYFLSFTPSSLEIDELALMIRAGNPQSKLIYVMDQIEAHALKAHQASSVGGDAYIPLGFNDELLAEMLESLKGPALNPSGNRLEGVSTTSVLFDFSELDSLKSHPMNEKIDQIFKGVLKSNDKKPMLQSIENFTSSSIDLDDLGDDMSDKDQDLSLDDLGDLELGSEDTPSEGQAADDGLELSLDDGDLDLSSEPEVASEAEDSGLDLSLDSDEDLSLSFNGDEDETQLEDDDAELDLDEDAQELSLSEDEDEVNLEENLGELSFEDDLPSMPDESLSLDESDDGLDLSDDSLDLGSSDLSEEAKEKLKEIDAIMDLDASQVAINSDLLSDEMSLDDDLSNLDEPLVSDDLNLDTLNFAAEEEPVVAAPKEDKPKRKKKEERDDRDLGADLKEISGAYSGEMERLQATISNLRIDREELLAKIQRLEDDKSLHNRSSLSIRAELDEKKIELSIIRKKLNDEITDLKDRLKVFDEKRSILEEKNKLLAAELDKAGQKNKIDLKKVQLRERELEQKLELLKADAETQIRNRDLKILELKRKVDSMEFDMESITQQEKRSVESRFELEDKLDKAIKTLRSAITVLEDESDRGNALDALKKNLDM